MFNTSYLNHKMCRCDNSICISHLVQALVKVKGLRGLHTVALQMRGLPA